MTIKRSVHLVDDDVSILASTATVLSARGFEVETYGSALEFLETVTAGTTGCVVTDVRMTGMTGIDLIAHLRERRISIPIIILVLLLGR